MGPWRLRVLSIALGLLSHFHRSEEERRQLGGLAEEVAELARPRGSPAQDDRDPMRAAPTSR